MTSISDTNVVNAPGGLVELGYSEITSPVNITVASGSYNTVINDMTIVSDGSPLVVEFYSPYISMPAGAPTYIVTALFVDGVVAGYLTESYSSANVGSTLEFPVHGVRRITLSAGVHTIGVRAFRGAVNGQVGASTGTGTNYPPAFLRVSKIIQASQLIVQTPNAPLVTSLPSNAIDGQEVRYLADNTNGIVWNFRYRAGSSSAYKWEFIGGVPLTSENSNYPAGQNSANWVDINSGATITPPLSGDYLVEHYGRTDSTNPTAQSLIEISAATSVIAATSVTGAVGFESTLTGVVRGAWARTQKLSGVTANDVIKLRQKMPVGSFSTVFFYTGMFVTPIRVSA